METIGIPINISVEYTDENKAKDYLKYCDEFYKLVSDNYEIYDRVKLSIEKNNDLEYDRNTWIVRSRFVIGPKK